MKTEYIRKQDAVERMVDVIINEFDVGITYAYTLAEDGLNLPPADVVPVRHGHWALVGWHKGMKIVECSCCKKRAIGATDFCPNCGAKMDGGENG
jgi:hypothetical protein